MSKAPRAVSMWLTMLVFFGIASPMKASRALQTQPPAFDPVGRWRVTIVLDGVKEEVIFEGRPRGSGSFLMSAGTSNEKPSITWLPAVWSRNAGRISFSGDGELPLGTCCREVGTVVLKGKFESRDSIAGKVVFVTSTDDDESPFKLRSAVGTFTAIRIPQSARPKSKT